MHQLSSTTVMLVLDHEDEQLEELLLSDIGLFARRLIRTIKPKKQETLASVTTKYGFSRGPDYSTGKTL